MKDQHIITERQIKDLRQCIVDFDILSFDLIIASVRDTQVPEENTGSGYAQRFSDR